MPPAGLLDQARELGTRFVEAAAAGEPVGQRQSEAVVLRHQAHRLLQHGDGPLQQTEARVDLGDLGRARHRDRVVVAVVAALAEHAGQRLPGLGVAIQVGEHGAQAVGARRTRPARVPGRRWRGAVAPPPRRRAASRAATSLRASPSVIARRRSSQSAAVSASPAASDKPAQRVERLGARIETNRVLPRSHRAAGVRERAVAEARRLRPQRRGRHRLRVLLQDARLLLEDVRQLRLPALGDQHLRQLAQRRPVSGALRQARAQHLGCVAALLEQPTQPNDLEPQRQTALAVVGGIELRDAQGDAVREAPLGLVQPRQRLTRGLVAGRLLVQQPPDPDRARRVA